MMILYTGAALANYKAVQIVPGPNAGPASAIVLSLGQYQLAFTGWDSTAIAAAWNASANPFFQQITASINGTALILTSNILGMDFEVGVTVNSASSGSVSTIQSLTVVATGGTFTLTDHLSHTSGAITYSATPATLVANIQAAINALTGYSSGDVVVSYLAGVYSLNFGSGQFAGLSIPLWTATSSLTGGTALATITPVQNGNAGTNEIISISFPATGTHTESLNTIQQIDLDPASSSGTFVLHTSYGNTPAIPFNAGRSVVKQAFEDLLGIDSVTVTGGPLFTASDPVNGTPVNATITDDALWITGGSYSASGTSIPINNDASSPGASVALLRFTVPVDQGASVGQALLTLKASPSGGLGYPCPIIIQAVAADDAAMSGSTGQAATDFANLTTASVIHTIPQGGSGVGSGVDTTVDIASVIEEVVARGGWVNGNHILLFIQQDTSTVGPRFARITAIESGNPSTLSLISTSTSGVRRPIVIEFIGGYAHTTISLMTDSGSANTTQTMLQAGGSQTVQNISGGTWTLVVTSSTQSYTIAAIPYNVTAGLLQSLINDVMGSGACTVTGGPAPGTPLVITFAGAFATAALAETLITSLTGNFGSSASQTVVRPSRPAPEPENIWDLTIIPGQGTLALAPGDPLVSRGFITLRFTEPNTDNPALSLGDQVSVYLQFYDLTPRKVEDAINEAFGKDVVRVTRITHSLEHKMVPTHTGSSVATAASPLHFWYFRDIYRMVFVNDYQPAASLVDVVATIATISDVNLNPATPSSWMSTEATPDNIDTADLYREAQRVYLGFVTLDAASTPLQLFSCSRFTGAWRNTLSYRTKLIPQYGGSVATVDAMRVGLARQLQDQALTFSWVKNIWADNNQTEPGQTLILASTSINWDAPASQIKSALEVMFPALSVRVTGSLFNSWLSEASADYPDLLDSYSDLHIEFIGDLLHLPLNELGYELICSVTNPHINNFPQLKNTQAWMEPYSVPLPGAVNQRIRFSLSSPEDVSALKLNIDGTTVDATPTTTAAELQTLLNVALGFIPVSAAAPPLFVGLPIPDRNRVPVTVYGTDLSSPIELEFTGAGFQFLDHIFGIGVYGDTTVALITVTQQGVDPVSEVQHLQISGSPHGGTYTVNGSGAITYNAAAAAIQTAVGSPSSTIATVTGTYPSFTLTWPASSGNITLWATTSSLNNSAITLTESQTGGRGASIVVSDLLAGSGPLYFDAPQNYTPNTVPGSNDTLVLDDATSPIRYGIDQTSTIVVAATGSSPLLQHRRNRQVFQNNQKVYLVGTGTAPSGLTFGNAYYIINQSSDFTFQLAASPSGSPIAITTVGVGTLKLIVKNLTLQTYSRFSGGELGLPNNNLSTGLPEYLSRYLVLPGVAAEIGVGDGNGLNLLRLDCGDEPAQVHIINSGQSQISNIPAVLLLFNDASSTLLQDNGDVGLSVYSNESSVLDTITVSGGSIALHNVTAASFNSTNGVTPRMSGTCVIGGVTTIE